MINQSSSQADLPQEG